MSFRKFSEETTRLQKIKAQRDTEKAPLYAKHVAQRAKEAKLLELQRSVYSNFYDTALRQGLISQSVYEKYAALREKSEEYSSQVNENNKTGVNGSLHKRNPQTLNELITNSTELSDDERLELGRFMSAEFLVLRSLRFFDISFHARTPKERFVELFRNLEKEHGPVKARELIKEAREKMRLRLTSTTHPTVLHTILAIMLERQLVGSLEEIARKIKNGEDIQEQDAFAAVNKIVADAKNPDTAFTHLNKVTLEEETEIESTNLDRSHENSQYTADGWNEAAKEIFPDIASGIAINDPSEVIVDATWNRSADADGRTKATAMELFRNISDAIKDGKLAGPKWDTRENSKKLANVFSALVQVAYVRSAGKKAKGLYPEVPSEDDHAFQKHCIDYVTDINQEGGIGKQWRNPKESVYQQLGEHKTKFVRNLLVTDFKLASNIVTSHVIPFMTEYRKIHNRFIRTYNSHVEEYNKEHADKPLQKLTTKTSYADLARIGSFDPDNFPARHPDFKSLLAQLRQQVEETKIKFDLANDKTGQLEHKEWTFELSSDGLFYHQGNKMIGHEYFLDRIKIDDKGNPVKLDNEERHQYMDTLKRLVVMNHFADKLGVNTVIDRHEIANFSGAENFYELMVLFKETGLIKIDNTKEHDIDKVVEAKIGIVPLLETLEDMENAEAIFTELLNDDLIKSYYKKRGYAEIMVGFSDGAKSAGNFASEWQIYKTTRMLKELFAKNGIEVRFKQGRGNNLNRGGTAEDGLMTSLMSDEVNMGAEVSVTTQACHPLERAECKAYGSEQLAGSLSGLVSGFVHAKTKADSQKDFEKIVEQALDFIQAVSANRFVLAVRKNKQAEEYLNNIVHNPDRSSRATGRQGNKYALYEDMRAVPVALKFDMANIPSNFIGLKEGIEALLSGKHVTLFDEKGAPAKTINSTEILEKLSPFKDAKYLDTVREECADIPGAFEQADKAATLEALTKHRFFEAFLRKGETELNANFDPNLANAYGQKFKGEAYVQAGLKSLTGLSDLMQLGLRRVAGYVKHKPQPDFIEQQLEQQRLVGHALILSSKNTKADIENPAQRGEAHTLRYAELITASGDRVPPASARTQRMPERIAPVALSA